MNKADEYRYSDIPPDLWPKKMEAYPFKRALPPLSKARDVSPVLLSNGIYLSRGLLGKVITVSTTPILLIKEPYTYPCIVLNPSTSVGLTTSVSGYAGTVIAAGDSQLTSLGVAGYEVAHFHLDVTAITGTWDIYAQTYDSLTNKWVDSQAIFSGITATGQSYASVGQFGIVTDLAFRWNPTVAGSLTFSLGAVFKNGLGGSSSGLARVVYLGSAGVSVGSGYPLLEGSKETFILGENVELWAIAEQSLNIRVFSL